ncbi:hypothetical protein F4678DRAFT_466115 [Xylaria arbuscula]|nr:hypothetical protein F4678DRAFT_466115 [Xylaria arbuscula]
MRFIRTVSALLPLVACEAAQSKPKISTKKLQADIKTKNLWSHLVALDKIATANGGNRAFGLPGYATSDFSALFKYVESIELKVNEESIYAYGLTYSPSTPDESIAADLILGPEGTSGCDASGYADLDVSGKVVLVDRFQCPTGGTLAGRVRPAAASGAVAVVVYNNVETNVPAGTLSAPSADVVPAGFINQADGLALKSRLEAGEKSRPIFNKTK